MVESLALIELVFLCSEVENIDLSTALDTTEDYIPLSLSKMYVVKAPNS